MSRKIIYVAHPLRPNEAELALIPLARIKTHEYEPDRRIAPERERIKAALDANIKAAMRWLSWLRRSFPETTFIAPWIASVLSGEDDTDESQRNAGLIDDCAVIERCDGIVLCGPRISDGMRREMEHGVKSDREALRPAGDVFTVWNLTYPINGSAPNSPVSTGKPFVEWCDYVRMVQ